MAQGHGYTLVLFEDFGNWRKYMDSESTGSKFVTLKVPKFLFFFFKTFKRKKNEHPVYNSTEVQVSKFCYRATMLSVMFVVSSIHYDNDSWQVQLQVQLV